MFMRIPSASALVMTLVLPFGAAASEAEIRAASDAWDRAYNAADVEALAVLYADDAVSMAPGAPASIGRDAIRADLEGFLEGNEARHTTEIQQIVVDGDLAVERANYAHDFTPAGGALTEERGKHVVVYRRGEDGSWKVLWEIWNEGQ